MLQLTVALLGREAQPQSRVNAARKEAVSAQRDPPLSDFVRDERPIDYFRYHGIRAVKLEEPGMDGWGRQLSAAFPDTPWLGNHRPIAKILRSHTNLKWGFSEHKLLMRSRRTLAFYEELASQGRLFMLNIDDPDGFDLASFADFVGARITAQARRMASEWPHVNDLGDLRAASGKPLIEVAEPVGLPTLHLRYPWVVEMEARFESLCRASGAGRR